MLELGIVKAFVCECVCRGGGGGGSIQISQNINDNN